MKQLNYIVMIEKYKRHQYLQQEDRKGSGKFDLNVGIDNTRFGVTVNAGYDTKGENVRGGLGFRLIY